LTLRKCQDIEQIKIKKKRARQTLKVGVKNHFARNCRLENASKKEQEFKNVNISFGDPSLGKN
jgi:hypothetical protein